MITRHTPLSTEQFIFKAKQTHGDRYDYSKVVYVNRHTKVAIVCNKHGLFSQKPAHHLNGHNCKQCGRDALAEKYRIGNWTEGDNNRLTELYIAGKTIRECASIFGWNIKTIRKQIKHLGLQSANERRAATEFKAYKDISSRYWRSVVNNAKSRNLPFEISISDVWNLFISQNGKCALTGWEISYGKKNTTASVDRIDSNKGYTKDNIQIVHKMVNQCKSNNTDEAFYQMCKTVHLHLKTKYEA